MAFTPTPDRPAPLLQAGFWGWLRQNLFSSVPNSLLTLVSLVFAWFILSHVMSWAVFNADWVGTSRSDCSRDGACWVFIGVRLQQFFYGFYPSDQLWRPNLVFFLLFVSLVWLGVPRLGYKKAGMVFALIIFPILAYVLLYGGVLGLDQVSTSRWGGLLLTIVLAVTGIVLAMPLGVALALGRRSNMPAVRLLSTLFIEFWRGVPLITILFMASVMLPLFFAEGVSLDRLLRALIGITLFQSAYIAEVVRGGLQALSKGQYEAADALGLSYWQKMYKVILPQAFKIMIPGLVNTTISLWKDTSLVVIIGLIEVLGSVRQALSDPEWLGFPTEGYVFAAFMFWVFCFGMSRYSQYLERRLNVGRQH